MNHQGHKGHQENQEHMNSEIPFRVLPLVSFVIPVVDLSVFSVPLCLCGESSYSR